MEESLHPGGLELTRRAVELCAFPARARIADVGCGGGASVRFLRERGFVCLGVDPEARAGADFPLIAGRAEEPPLAGESFDGLLCECVLSLSSRPSRLLRSLQETLRAGGRLLLSDLYRETSGRTGAGEAPLSRGETERLLREAGLRVLHFEDHTRCLKKFAADLIWRGEAGAALLHLGPALRDGGKDKFRDLGYGLWIAEK
jgi:SAM-dependent methyltransferase